MIIFPMHQRNSDTTGFLNQTVERPLIVAWHLITINVKYCNKTGQLLLPQSCLYLPKSETNPLSQDLLIQFKFRIVVI